MQRNAEVSSRLHIVYRRGDPEGERTHRRNGNDNDDDRVFQRAEEELILEKLLIVTQPDKDIHGVFAHVGVKEAGVYAQESGIQHKGDEEEQTRQQKQVSRCCFPPYERAAHAVFG